MISGDPEDLDGVTFLPLFNYHPTFVAATNHPLAAKDFIVAEDFRDQTLITYPVEKTRLDVYTELPDWVGEDQKYNHDIVAKPLTASGVTRSLFAAVRTADLDLGFIQDFASITRKRQNA